MGIDGTDDIIETSSKIEEKPIPDKDQFCRCGHSLLRHRQSNSGKNMICIERFCPCSSFRLARVV